MSRLLAPIPDGIAITERSGTGSGFFLLRWQELRDGFGSVPVAGSVTKTGQTASLATTAVLTLTSSGWYRISTYARVTSPDGVSSSLSVTVGWTENAQALTKTSAAMTGDTVTTGQSTETPVYADASTDLTVATTYASNTPNLMVYEVMAIAEQLR